MKRLTSLLIVVVVLAGFMAACQPETVEVTRVVEVEKEVEVEREVEVTKIVEVEKEVQVTVEVEKIESTPIPEGVMQINFWNVLGGWRTPILEGLVTDFNLQHPGIAVVNEFKGSYRDLIQAAIQSTAAGEPPHISQIFEAGTQLALDTEIWMPAEDAVAQCGLEVDWDKYLDAPLNYYTIEGKHYSFPWNTSSPIMYYNKDILDAAGLEMPKDPTFEDIEVIGRALVDGGYVEYAFAGLNHSWFYENWIATQGGNLVDQNNSQDGRVTEVLWDSEEAKRTFTWYLQLYKDGLLIDSGIEAWGEVNRIFLSQQAAMMMYSTSAVLKVESDARENGFEANTAYIPAPADVERQGVVIGGASLYVAKGLPQDELCAATEFMLWISATPQTIRFHQSAGYFPSTKQAVDVLEAEGWFSDHPDQQTAIDQLTETKVGPATQGAKFGALLEVRTIIEKQWEQMMADVDAGMSVEDAVEKNLAAAKEASDVAIADYNATIGE